MAGLVAHPLHFLPDVSWRVFEVLPGVLRWYPCVFSNLATSKDWSSILAQSSTHWCSSTQQVMTAENVVHIKLDSTSRLVNPY